MPDSIFLEKCNQSDISDFSSKTADSKRSDKKISFNKAVLVKRYPWIPDSDFSQTRYLTMPVDRFWFKVHDQSQKVSPLNPSNEKSNVMYKTSAKYFQDYLTPINEYDDYVFDVLNQHGTCEAVQDHECKTGKENYTCFSHRYNFDSQSVNSGMNYRSHKHFNTGSTRSSRKLDFDFNEKTQKVSKSPCLKNSNSSRSSSSVKRYKPRSETANSFGNGETHTKADNLAVDSIRLPALINNNYFKRCVKEKNGVSYHTRASERRSKSQEISSSNENKLKDSRKVDKCVSTEDLDILAGYISNKILKPHGDTRKKCFKTASSNVEPNQSISSNTRSSSKPRYLSTSNTSDDLKLPNSCGNSYNHQKKNAFLLRFAENDASGKSKLCGNSFSKLHSEKQLERIVCVDRAVQTYTRSHSNGKDVTRNSTIIPIVSRKACQTIPNGCCPKYESTLRKDSMTKKEINQDTSVGCVRGRQILSNTEGRSKNRKPCCENTTPSKSSVVDGEKVKTTKAYLNRNKSNVLKANESSGKTYLIPCDERNGNQCIKIKNVENETPSSDYKEDSHSVIDWSLSGFLMKSKQECDSASISYSECTSRTKPSLRMYIPGISAYDCQDVKLPRHNDVFRSVSADRPKRGSLSVYSMKEYYS